MLRQILIRAILIGEGTTAWNLQKEGGWNSTFTSASNFIVAVVTLKQDLM